MVGFEARYIDNSKPMTVIASQNHSRAVVLQSQQLRHFVSPSCMQVLFFYVFDRSRAYLAKLTARGSEIPFPLSTLLLRNVSEVFCTENFCPSPTTLPLLHFSKVLY